jgi:hypothetical protein
MRQLTRRCASILALTILCIGTFGNMASAHVLKQNNGVSAVLHIAPYDAPVSGKPIQVKFDFSNTAGTFSLTDYRIRVQVRASDKSVQTYDVKPEFFGTSTQGLATIIFPNPDVYSLNLIGMSSVDGSRFTIPYDVRVTPGTDIEMNYHKNDQILVVGVTGVIIIVTFTMVAVKQLIAGKRYSSNLPHDEKDKKDA